MSHFSQVKTQIRNLTALKAALTDLGMDWKSGSTQVRGYQGQTYPAEITISQENGYDIGFTRKDKAYELVADLQFWQQPVPVERFVSQVTQRYAYHTVINTSAEQGFQVTQQQENKDGSIRLVVQRWSA